MATEYQLRESPTSYAPEPTRARAAEQPISRERPGPMSVPTGREAILPQAPVSGFYWFRTETLPPPPQPPLRFTASLRVDVDGRNPQMTISGRTVFFVNWIATVAPAGPDQWSGTIWYKQGNNPGTLPQTDILVTAIRSSFPEARSMTVEFSGGGGITFSQVYNFTSSYYHSVDFEFDAVENTVATTAVFTCAHPNRPASMACETLSIEEVYRRAGFDVTVSQGSGTLPITGAGGDALWSDQEMHDAMQVYWSRFADAPQWAMWVLFAATHEIGTSLGGIMFDDIGPNHRQGTAIFNDSFISTPPVGDPAPDAWVQRMRFWTAIHEMGHGFNLAHSWQKSLGVGWIPLTDEPEARSPMNYPYNVVGGEAAFFADFEYRFSDQELLFMRHAPDSFVQMGNADWFDNHGFEQAHILPNPALKLELRVNRAKPEFEFLEPVMMELKLTNTSDEPVLIEEDLLAAADHLTVVIKKDRAPARQWLPYAHYCHKHRKTVLAAGQSCYGALFAAAGRKGWDLAEPGRYLVQVALRHDGQDLVSNPLNLRIAPPRGYDEEYLAQDFFTDEVGRVLAFDGSQVLDEANDVLRESASKLADRRVAQHALVALAKPLMRNAKMLALPDKNGAATIKSAAEAGGKFKVAKAKPDEARKQLNAALLKKDNVAAETLGHIEYREYVDQYSDWLAANGDSSAAAKAQSDLGATLKARNVADWVLKAIERKRDGYRKKA
jgi:hypothetical protein